MEADSLNASILGADAGPGSEEFDLFVKEAVREMTVKAGQKCTAIRRILVPRAACEAVIKAIGERLAKTTVGDPRDEAVRMGPLASLAQREEVRARVHEIRAEAEIVAGDPQTVRVVSGDAEKGAFLNPVLLHCDRPASAAAVHDVEAFGPVSTVMPYGSADEAIELARRGKGSLVASVFTNDPDIARELVTGLAPFHGRVLIGNRAGAKSSTGHGSPLPGLVHGGPGRAGGGEELGGMRSVTHCMQRTAVQGPPRLLSAVTGRWMDGAPAEEGGAHPFRKSLADLHVGDRIVTAKRTVMLDDIEHFAHFTGDTFYAHMDEAAATANPLFNGRVAHGYLIVSFAAGLFVDPTPGPVLANYGVDNLRFLTPVKPGDTLQARLTCKEIKWGKFNVPVPPAPLALSLAGVGALAVNLSCASMLARYQAHGGSLTRAAFFSSRNDALANIAIIAAGVATAFLWPSAWPDLIVGLGIAAMNADAAHDVWTAAHEEHATAVD